MNVPSYFYPAFLLFYPAFLLLQLHDACMIYLTRELGSIYFYGVNFGCDGAGDVIYFNQ